MSHGADAAEANNVELKPLPEAAVNQPEAYEALDIFGTNKADNKIRPLMALLNNMLLNSHDTFGQWLIGVLKNKIKIVDRNRLNRETSHAYDKAIEHIQTLAEGNQTSGKSRYANSPNRGKQHLELARLSLTHLYLEADVWVTRGNAQLSKVKYQRPSAVKNYETAEQYFINALPYFYILRDKFIALKEMNLDPVANEDVAKIDKKIQEIKEDIFTTRISKHVSHIFNSIQGKQDPYQLLFSLASLANGLSEISKDQLGNDVENKDDAQIDKEAWEKAELQDKLHVWVKNRIASVLVNLEDPALILSLHRGLTQMTFIDTQLALEWLGAQASNMNLDVFDTINNEYKMRLEHAINANWDPDKTTPYHDEMLDKLKSLYDTRLQKYRKEHGVYVDPIDPTIQVLLLRSAKEQLLQGQFEYCRLEFGLMSASLADLLEALKEGVNHALKKLSFTYPELKNVTTMTAASTKYKNFTAQPGDYHNLLDRARAAANTIVQEVMLENLWYPRKAHVFDENPTEVDINNADVSSDLIEELRDSQRKRFYM